MGNWARNQLHHRCSRLCFGCIFLILHYTHVRAPHKTWFITKNEGRTFRMHAQRAARAIFHTLEAKVLPSNVVPAYLVKGSASLIRHVRAPTARGFRPALEKNRYRYNAEISTEFKCALFQ